MEVFKGIKLKSLPRSIGGSLSAESVEGVYKRHLQGAWVRSGTSVFMWFFALIAYHINTIDRFGFTGVSFTVIYLILINPPTLGILKWIRGKKSIAVLSLSIHGLEIIGYTAIIYFAGGMGRGYLVMLYPALINYVGFMSPRHWPFIVALFCSLAMFSVLALQYLELIRDTSLQLRNFTPYGEQFFDVSLITGLMLVVAFISSYTSGLLRKGRERLMKSEKILVERNLALEEAMKRAQASDHRKSEFLANMSHELRTPLNHIIGFTELVSDRAVGPLNAIQEEYLNDVLGSSRHLLSLISDILDLSKVEAGKMELEVSEIAFQALLENSLDMVKEKALKHGIKIGTRFMEIPPIIRADERKLKQILYNLLSNAVKFTPDGGAFLLEARGVAGQGVEIMVSDTGIGLLEADLERIFQPFEQGDNSSTRKYQGTGLGLSLTKRLVELHGGSIWAKSDGVGAGSAFAFTVPS